MYKKWDFYFLIWIHFVFLLEFLLLKLPKYVELKVAGNGHPCLVPGLRWNAFSFSPLRMMLGVGLLYTVFLIWSSLYAHFLESCYHKWVLSFVKVFSASIEMIMWFLFFNLLMWCITLIDLQILKNPCIPGINPT